MTASSSSSTAVILAIVYAYGLRTRVTRPDNNNNADQIVVANGDDG
jgi:hypothetical protein